MGQIKTRLLQQLKDNLPLVLFIAFSIIFTLSLTIGPKLDYDVWFHYRAGEYFFVNGKAPSVPIDSWYAMTQNIYWVSHEWLFGVFTYWLMMINPILINLLSPVMLSIVVALVAYYNRHLFEKNPAIAYIGIILLINVFKLGNTPRPHLIAYLFTFLLFAILRKDAKVEGNTIFWLIPLTIAWVNLHGGSYILLFIFLFLNILSGVFEFDLGKIEFKKSSPNHQLKRIIVFIVGMVCVGLNAHGIHMYLYPLSNFADNLMQSSISEWASPDLKVSWQIYLYLTMAIFVSALIATQKKIRAVDFLTGFAYIYLTLRSIRFAPQMAIVVMMVVSDYTDSVDGWFGQFSKKLTITFSALMLVIGAFSLIPSVTTYSERELFVLNRFPTDALIETIKDIKPERLYNPYDAGGYLTYKGIDVFVDGRADIYTTINLKDALSLNKGGYNYLELVEKYDFDYMLVFARSTLDALLKANPHRFVEIYTEEKFILYRVIQTIDEVDNQ